MRRRTRPADRELPPVVLALPDEMLDYPPARQRTAVPGALCVAVAVLALLAAAGSYATWRHRAAEHVATVVEPSRAVGLDASGCPTTASCDYAGQPLAGIQRAVGLAFPAAHAVAGATTWRSPDETPFSSSLVAVEPDGTVLTVVARCLPAGGPVAPSEVLGTRSAVIVVPGRAGCSVAVAGYSTQASRVDSPQLVRQLDRVAHDPGVQLPG